VLFEVRRPGRKRRRRIEPNGVRWCRRGFGRYEFLSVSTTLPRYSNAVQARRGIVFHAEVTELFIARTRFVLLDNRKLFTTLEQ